MSGQGRENGEAALEHYTELKTVTIKLGYDVVVIVRQSIAAPTIVEPLRHYHGVHRMEHDLHPRTAWPPSRWSRSWAGWTRTSSGS